MFIVYENNFIQTKMLAKELGVSFATINRWENGKIKPSFLMEKRFSDYCERKEIRFD